MLDDLRHRAGHGHFTSSVAPERRKSVGYPTIIEDGGHVLRSVCDWLAAHPQRKYCQSNELLKSSRLPVPLQEKPGETTGSQFVASVSSSYRFAAT
jgi:hypothetical protein